MAARIPLVFLTCQCFYSIFTVMVVLLKIILVKPQVSPEELCCRVILGKDPLPIWPEFFRGPDSLMTSLYT